MADMTAFERQVQGHIHRFVGPVHPVDDLAILDAVVAASRSQGWGFRTFSALKVVAAAAIVALFGGFLLITITPLPRSDEMAPAAVTESPSPMTTEELLTGMVTEEVEPGVFRVINDGVRSLSPTEALRIAAGHDGNIRLLDYHGFYRLGSEEYHEWPTPLPYGYAPNSNPVLEVAPDGTMWIIPIWSQVRPDMRVGSPLRSSHGEEWTAEPCPGESAQTQAPGDCSGVSVAPDGTAWASWSEGTEDGDGTARVGRFGPTGWQPLDGDAPYEFSRIAFTDAGTLYGISYGWISTLHRYEDGVWQKERTANVLVDVGLDGTVWQDAGWCKGEDPSFSCGQDGLARLAGREWQHWTSVELPEISLGFGHDGEFQVAPDGNPWFSLWRSADGTDPREVGGWQQAWNHGDPRGFLACDGLARFDGQTLDRFMTGQCISMDISADGSVWVLGDNDLYVITPEAVAATR